MADTKNNIAAGLLDLGAVGQSYLATLSGAASGLANASIYPLLDALTGNNKSRGFTEDFSKGFSENPEVENMGRYYNWVTKTTGADEDSWARDITGNLDIILAPGAGAARKMAFSRAGTKVLKGIYSDAISKGLTKDQARELVKRRIDLWKKDPSLRKTIALDNPVPYNKEYAKAIAKSALKKGNIKSGITAYAGLTALQGALSGELKGPAVVALGALGGSKLIRGQLAKRKTITDLFPLTEEEKKLMEDVKMARDFEAGQKRMDWDASGGARDSAKSAGIIDDVGSVSLSANAEDRANRSSFIKTAFKETVETTKANEFKNNFAVNNEFGAVNGIVGARVGGLRQYLKQAERNPALLERIGLTPEQADSLLTKLELGDVLERFDAAIPALERMNYVKGMDEISNKALRDRFVTLRAKVGKQHFLTPMMKDMIQRANNIAFRSGLINSKELEQYADDITSGIYVPLRPDNEVSGIVKRSNNPYKEKRTTLLNTYTKEVQNQGVDDPRNSYNTLFEKVYGIIVAAERNNMINSSIPSLKYSIDKARENINEGIIRLERAGKKSEADTLREMLDVYKPIQTISKEEIKRVTAGLKKRSEREAAVDALRKSYTDKGYYELVHYRQGKEHYTYVPKDFEYVFEMRPVDTRFFNKLNKATNRFFTEITSGKFNPFFIPKRIMYAENELSPAIVTELAKQGINLSVWDVRKLYFKELYESFKTNLAITLDEAVKDNIFLGKLAKGSVERYRQQIDEILERDARDWNKIADYNIIKNDVVGEAFRNTNGSIDVSIKPTFNNKLYEMAMRFRNWVDSSSLVRVISMIKNAVDDATPKTIVRAMERNNLENAISKEGKVTKEGSKFVHNVTRKMADTRRRGTGDTLRSKAFNAIQDYTPYGSAIIQGIAGKSEYLHKHIVDDAVNYIKRAYKVNGNMVDTGFDVLGKMGQQLARLPDNVVFNVLWTTIALPSLLCYLWNYGSEDNARYYNSLKPWERSNKFQMVNFFGDGINLCVPLDQEWSVVKNIFDAMLERTFGLSDSLDRGNPAFSMRDQMLWSLGQDFGISLPVAAEGSLNVMGVKTNLDLGTILNGESPIQAIDKNRYHTVPDGIAEATITMTSKLGKILVNLAEDRPVMDYRYAIPFLQIDPKQKATSDTVSYLNRELKLHPTPELKDWSNKRRYIMNNMSFYDRYGTTQSGKVIGTREEVRKMYQAQLDELNRSTYESITE